MMNPRLWSLLFAALVLGGCSTPPEVSRLSKVLVREMPKLPESHAADLEAVADHLEQAERIQADYAAQAARAHQRLVALAQILEQESLRAARAEALARWDTRAVEILHRDFPRQVESAYFPVINGRRDALEAAFQAATKAREGRADDGTLLAAQQRAALRLVALDEAAHRELVLLYDHLHDQVAGMRAQLLQDLQVQPASGETAFTRALAAFAPGPGAAATEGSTPAPESNSAKLRARAKEVRTVDQPLRQGLGAVDFYLETDGYSRVMAKSAVAGLAKGLADQAGDMLPGLGQSIGGFAGKLGLDPAKVEQQVTDGAAKLLEKAQQEFAAKVGTQADQALTRLNTLLETMKAQADRAAAQVLRADQP